MEDPSGNRWMQTFKKEPMHNPKTSAYHLKKIGIIGRSPNLFLLD
jgi:hypothetical protein